MKLGVNMIATRVALVFGLLMVSPKPNFDTMNSGIIHTSSKIILLDRVMAHFGPETKEIRNQLRRGVASSIERHNDQ